jgi:hypothetical protein
MSVLCSHPLNVRATVCCQRRYLAMETIDLNRLYPSLQRETHVRDTEQRSMQLNYSTTDEDDMAGGCIRCYC